MSHAVLSFLREKIKTSLTRLFAVFVSTQKKKTKEEEKKKKKGSRAVKRVEVSH